MASPLAASLVATNSSVNMAFTGDTVGFKFSQPPPDASDVSIDILQISPPGQPHQVLATFEGSIKNGSYVPGRAVQLQQPRQDMRLKLTDGTNTVEVHMVDPVSFTLSNQLRVTVRGTIAGAIEFFDGRSPLHVWYRQAMIVSTARFVRDPDLNALEPWAKQWRDFQKDSRTLVPLAPIRPPPPQAAITPRDYDPLVAAFTSAAQASQGGIIALTVGHGDGGQSAGFTTPWCDLVGEDARDTEPDGSHSYPHRLLIFEPELNEGRGATSGGITTTPGPQTIVKMNALDRIADAITPPAGSTRQPIRKVILHTCNAGNSVNFIQMIADRLRVPVQAHTDFIAYTLVPKAIRAHYDSQQPQVPRDLHEWPVELLAVERRPGPPPKRWPVP
jgi:hypothetical protein